MTNETWITFSDADVFAANAPERKAIVAIKREDDLAAICSQVTNQIRQAYALSNRDLGDAGKIPEGLKLRAIAIATWRFVTEKVPRNPVFQTRERGTAAKEASEFIDALAASKYGVATRPSISKRHRHFRHRDEDGI